MKINRFDFFSFLQQTWVFVNDPTTSILDLNPLRFGLSLSLSYHRSLRLPLCHPHPARTTATHPLSFFLLILILIPLRTWHPFLKNLKNFPLLTVFQEICKTTKEKQDSARSKSRQPTCRKHRWPRPNFIDRPRVKVTGSMLSKWHSRSFPLSFRVSFLYLSFVFFMNFEIFVSLMPTYSTFRTRNH